MNKEGYKDPTAEQAVHNVTKKRWSEMKADEILEIKKNQCRFCRYANRNNVGEDNLSNLYCDYIGIVGHSRGCRPDECNKFKPKNGRKRRKKPITLKKG
ncbi:MAG: hypothetical protein MR332_13280 [Fusicatenibacter sp.]|nr:hypothetical protein [Fusicatenibacter sp.]